MISTHLFRPPWQFTRLFRRTPKVVAIFSFRYDALVPDLIENLRPIVDGYAAYDDRGAAERFSPEPQRRQLLVDAARGMGAAWIGVDPDERLEARLARKIRMMTAKDRPIRWGFNIREMYSPTAYRVDGIWGEKYQYRLFPAEAGAEIADQPLHGEWSPANRHYRSRKSGFNLYHLKMITRARRLARRDLYNQLDPDRNYQEIGYDYLANDEGAVLEEIPAGRGYKPPHRDDGGLWMAEMDAPRVADSGAR